MNILKVPLLQYNNKNNIILLYELTLNCVRGTRTQPQISVASPAVNRRDCYFGGTRSKDIRDAQECPKVAFLGTRQPRSQGSLL